MTYARIEHARELLALGRHQDALDVLASVLQEEPTNATAHSNRAVSLALLQRFDEAIRAAHVALRLAPAAGFAHYALGQVLTLKGDVREARTSARAALDLQPYVADYHALLANTFIFEQQWKHANQSLDRGLQLDPENKTCLFLKAYVLSVKGKRSAAWQAIEGLLRIDPHHAAGLALYESLQRDAGVPNVASLSLQVNPRKGYVKSVALEDILRQSVAFRWVLTTDRLMMRVGPRPLLIIFIVVGVVLWHSASFDATTGGRFRSIFRGLAGAYAGGLFAMLFGWCLADIYARFHAQGRWLLSSVRRRGAEIAMASLAGGVVVLILAGVLRSRDLAFAGAGMMAGGVVVSKSLNRFLHLASPSELFQTFVVSSLAMIVIAACAGFYDQIFIETLAVYGATALVGRLAGWPRLE